MQRNATISIRKSSMCVRTKMAASGGFREARECDSNDESRLILDGIVDRFSVLAVGDSVYTINSEKKFEHSCCFSGLESKQCGAKKRTKLT